MNLSKLFEIQKVLDDRIVEEHNLQGIDLLDKKILALQVELGELANEWRGFKIWSKDQMARTEDKSWYVATETIEHYQDGFHSYSHATVYQKYKRNPLLEEYVDCLHFISSIGNDRPLNVNGLDLLHESVVEHNIRVYKEMCITQQFISVNRAITDYEFYRDQENYEELLLRLIALGEMLGFTWEQIEQAYLDKNEINHVRQENGY